MFAGRPFTWLALLLLGLGLAGSQVKQGAPLVGQGVITIGELPSGSGQLAFVGRDGNVYVTAPGQDGPLAITRDATAGIEGQGLSYHRLSWSPDGRLAFASITRALAVSESRLLVVDRPREPIQEIGRSKDHFVIYIYWSPAACPEKPRCRQLAYLIEEENGIALRLVELDKQEVANERIGLGGPLYYSWSPDGRHILWHSGGARRNNDQARLSLYSLESKHSVTLNYEPGSFLAPAWSPVGRDWLAVIDDGRLDRLGVSRPGQGLGSLVEVNGRRISFSWSPDGRQIAYALSEPGDFTVYGPVQLLDLESRGPPRQLTGSFRIEAFFWSPDGARLAYLTRPAPGGEFMQWRVADVKTGRDRGYAMFRPADQIRFITHSFNQYAQSHRFWSPEGRYLVYAEKAGQDGDRIWLVDTWAPRGATPIFVDEGSLAVWSWE